MILENAYLMNDKNTGAVFPEETRHVASIHMEVQDSLQTVLDTLHHQSQPVLLLLPSSGDTFRRPEDFLDLRSFLAERDAPAFLCLVLPSQRTHEAALATSYGIKHASSLEEALQLLAHFYDTDDMRTDPLSQRVQKRPGQSTETILKVKTPSLQNAPSLPTPTKRWPLVAVALTLLLLASVIVAPLLLIPTHTITHTAAAATTPFGTLTFTSSRQFDPTTIQGYNDIITLSLRSLPAPPTGMAYDVWLLPDPNDDGTTPLLIGSLRVPGPVRLTYTSPDHTNLLASYSAVRVTVQPSDIAPDAPSQDPADWRWQGALANRPALGDEHQYSLLSHIRHLLASDPTLQANKIPGGLAIWLTRNVAKVEEWASAAQGDWHGAHTSGGDARQIHNHMLRILEYLDGAFYYTQDVPVGSPWLVDPQAGKIGLLNRGPHQNPPGYVAHIDIHLTGVAGAPGHTTQQQQLATMLHTVLNTVSTNLLQVRTDAARLVKMNTQQLQQHDTEAQLNEMASLTTDIQSGWFDARTGENRGGVIWMASRLQQLTTIVVSPL